MGEGIIPGVIVSLMCGLKSEKYKYEMVTHLWGCGKPNTEGEIEYCVNKLDCMTNRELFWAWTWNQLNSKEDEDRIREMCKEKYGD